MADTVVLAKGYAGVQCREHAYAYAIQHGGKSWKYLLIPHDVVAENMTLDGLVKMYTEKPSRVSG